MNAKPQLRFFDLTMIVVSMVIGIGIFRNPSIIAKSAGNEIIFYLAWIIGGIISIFGALIFAELGSRIPLTGGYYKTFSHSYPRPLAFALTWGYLALNAGATSAVAYTGAQYIGPVILPDSLQNETGNRILFFVVILVLFIVNFLGLRAGAVTQNILSSIKIALVVLFCSAVFFANPTAKPAEEAISSSKNFLYAIGTSLISVFFSYGGYQNATNLGGDIRNSQKNITKGIITGVGIVIVLYLTINFVYVQSLGFTGVQQSPLIAADIARILFGNAGAKIASIVIFISIAGWLNTALLFNPRVLYAMSEEGTLPKLFSATNEKKQVQEFSLIFYTCLIIFFFLILQSYENLLNYVMFNDTIVLAFAAFCIFLLRKKQNRQMYSGFTIKWFPFIPIVFIMVILGVTASVAISDLKNAMIGLLVLLAGFPIYWIIQATKKP